MVLTDFDFPFDSTLIADRPVEPRDQARLLVVPRTAGPLSHRRVMDLPALLNLGDLLVVNDTKVLAVRLVGCKRPGGGRLGLVFVRELGEGLWEVLFRGNAKRGQVIEFGKEATATVVERTAEQTIVKLDSSLPSREIFEKLGQVPLPPYIKRAPRPEDRHWYQTVFAREAGAIAAPTAGLHFTERLLTALRQRGIELATVTLHVGPPTFRPVMTERIEEHPMGGEQIEVPTEAIAAIAQAKQRGGRIVAVGTTVVRALESAAQPDGTMRPMRGETTLYITPGYGFKVVDVLLTNFHLPRTTLLMLVSALTGVERLRAAYEEAIRAHYRFYSYGDVMLIL